MNQIFEIQTFILVRYADSGPEDCNAAAAAGSTGETAANTTTAAQPAAVTPAAVGPGHRGHQRAGEGLSWLLASAFTSKHSLLQIYNQEKNTKMFCESML